MDALRVPAKRDLGRTVIFKVDLLRVADDWAFARVSPILPDGGEIDYSKTKYREQVELGAFDPQAEALLRRTVDGWDVGNGASGQRMWKAPSGRRSTIFPLRF